MTTYIPKDAQHAVDRQALEYAASELVKQKSRADKLAVALRRCIPADGEAAKLKHEALLEHWS